MSEPLSHRPASAPEASGHYGPRGARPRPPAPGLSPFVPMLILVLGISAWSGFQLHHLLLEFDAIKAARAGQEAQVQQAQRVAQALEALAQETRKLADAGNANAKTVVEELRKRGVTINAPAGAKPEK